MTRLPYLFFRGKEHWSINQEVYIEHSWRREEKFQQAIGGSVSQAPPIDRRGDMLT